MMQKLCYVDPLYFIEHKLYKKINDPNCAYFDLFPEDLIENYNPFVVIKEYPHYIASGIFDNILYYDVCKHTTNDNYNLLMSVNLSISEYQKILYISINFDQNIEPNNYIAIMSIIGYECESQPGEILHTESIFFDHFQDLFGIIKNTIRQNIIGERND